MKIKIDVFSIDQYKKNGMLKKKAYPVSSWSIGDTGVISDKDKKDFMQDVATKLKKELHNFESPDIFTHINAFAGDHRVTIFETVTINGNDFMTTPKELYQLLITK